MLRGGRNFDDVAADEQFLKDLLAQLNAGRRGQMAEEMGRERVRGRLGQP